MQERRTHTGREEEGKRKGRTKRGDRVGGKRK